LIDNSGERLTAVGLHEKKKKCMSFVCIKPLSGHAAVKLALNYQSAAQLSCKINVDECNAEQKVMEQVAMMTAGSVFS